MRNHHQPKRRTTALSCPGFDTEGKGRSVCAEGRVEVRYCKEVRLVAGRDDSRDGQTNGSRARGDDAAQLQSQLGFLEEEISTLRRKLAESPRSVRVLEERLADAQATLAGVTGQNERLVGTLKEAREQIIALREEVDRLAQPPSGYGVFLSRHDDGTIDIFTGGRKLRVTVSPAVEVADLR